MTLTSLPCDVDAAPAVPPPPVHASIDTDGVETCAFCPEAEGLDYCGDCDSFHCGDQAHCELEHMTHCPAQLVYAKAGGYDE